MMDVYAVVALFRDLPELELTSWIERGWVIPEAGATGFEFHEIDVARVRLIHDLRRDMEVAEDAMSLVLSLLDQVYELRSTLKVVLQTLQTQPPDVREAILGALARGTRTR